jgi:hypothetical protein
MNFSFGLFTDLYWPFMSQEDKALCLKEPRSITIGDEVVISRNALVLDGAEIGVGCLIAAGAVVTGRCEPYGVYGGVPARRLRDRLTPEQIAMSKQLNLANVCAHNLPTLPSSLARVECGEAGFDELLASLDYLKARPKLFLKAARVKSNVQITDVCGYAIGNDRITNPSTVTALNDYFAQAINVKSKTLRWSPDIFRSMGLC